VDIIRMIVQVLLIKYRVLDETRLPDPATSLAMIARRNGLFGAAGPEPLGSELRLDRLPSIRLVHDSSLASVRAASQIANRTSPSL
jgi:hypothetical protein